MEHETLATELLHEVKASARRWFIAFLVMCAVEVGTIAGFLYYISLPIEEYHIEQDTGEGGHNYNIGGNYNGEAEDKLQEERQENNSK